MEFQNEVCCCALVAPTQIAICSLLVSLSGSFLVLLWYHSGITLDITLVSLWYHSWYHSGITPGIGITLGINREITLGITLVSLWYHSSITLVWYNFRITLGITLGITSPHHQDTISTEEQEKVQMGKN